MRARLNVNFIYPVGSIYMSVNSANPSIIFGGTWEQIKDKFLLACGNNFSNGSSGGEINHTLTIEEMPKHYHDRGSYTDSPNTGNNYYVYVKGGNSYGSSQTSLVGNNMPHNNMPPYLAIYIWKRIS